MPSMKHKRYLASAVLDNDDNMWLKRFLKTRILEALRCLGSLTILKVAKYLALLKLKPVT